MRMWWTWQVLSVPTDVRILRFSDADFALPCNQQTAYVGGGRTYGNMIQIRTFMNIRALCGISHHVLCGWSSRVSFLAAGIWTKCG